MRTTRRFIIFLACILIGMGLILSLGAMAGMKFDLSRIHTATYHLTSHTVEESFTSISVDVQECSVRLLPSQDGVCRVECPENEDVTYSISVEQQTLTVVEKDTRPWWGRIQIGFNLGNMELTIYLPEQTYQNLSVETISGDVSIPDSFSFDSANVHNTSGAVRFSAGVAQELTIETISGNLDVTGVKPQTLTLQTTSGEVNIARGIVGGSCRIDSVSGGVNLIDCDANALEISTISGDVSASLRTGKDFSTQTVSGNVDVPSSTSGGTCQISTVSGNITCTIE